MIITDCLGRTREVTHVYQDGSYGCPFCSSPVETESPAHVAQKCPNPGCFARGGEGIPPFPESLAREEIARREAAEKIEHKREEIARFRAEYAAKNVAEKRERIAAAIREAEERGACVRCAVAPVHEHRAPKFVKHRIVCPRAGQ